ncbi:hypothetical protein [Olleya sp. YS]|uniref:hypothetical protein n=1 Tax=Olleya sp. YS TaxID=3028318 RepID=UPI0024341386|nr:hypothetical protein [Olleya sp. YS]WGD35255.1 hypothetical protein Ollyesu_02325 [Olleya sp. YS]
MKSLILKSKFYLVILTLLAFMSCSDDDMSEPQVQAPSVSYSATTLDAMFFTAGNSPAPTLNWNGNQGSFYLANTINGLNINSTTGVLNWTHGLPAGTHDVQVIAVNSAGQTTINMTINNPLQGTFTGTYDNTYFFEIEFMENGTLLLSADDVVNPYTATGTWAINGSNIQVDYTYDLGGDYSLSGPLTLGTNAVYSGDWFYDHGTISGNEGGIFEITLN